MTDVLEGAAVETPLTHVTLALYTPDLSGLTGPELQKLRARGQALVKDLRKKSSHLVFKEPELKEPWLRTMAKGTPEERKRATEELERLLLKYPDAFYFYAQINGLLGFDTLIQAELLKRAETKGPVKVSVRR